MSASTIGSPVIRHLFRWFKTADFTPLKLKSYGASSMWARGKSMACGFPSFASLSIFRSARIAESDGTGYLVEGFSGCVVSRSSEDFERTVIFYNDKMGMASGDDFTQERRLQIRVFDIVRRDVAFNMVNADQRFLFFA